MAKQERRELRRREIDESGERRVMHAASAALLLLADFSSRSESEEWIQVGGGD